MAETRYPQTDANIIRNPDFDKAFTIYEFTVRNIRGEKVKLDVYKGFICLIVNIATKSKFTKGSFQFLNLLHEQYAEKGLRILAFPCNQFDEGEPGTPEDIMQFMEENKVKFDVFDKIDVNSLTAHPLWKFLKLKLGNADQKGSVVKTDFTMFVVGRNGIPQMRYGPDVEPQKIFDCIEMFIAPA